MVFILRYIWKHCLPLFALGKSDVIVLTPCLFACNGEIVEYKLPILRFIIVGFRSATIHLAVFSTTSFLLSVVSNQDLKLEIRSKQTMWLGISRLQSIRNSICQITNKFDRINLKSYNIGLDGFFCVWDKLPILRSTIKFVNNCDWICVHFIHS